MEHRMAKWKKGDVIYWHDAILGNAMGTITTKPWRDSRLGWVCYVTTKNRLGRTITRYPVAQCDLPAKRAPKLELVK